jgi:hypothetical protein
LVESEVGSGEGDFEDVEVEAVAAGEACGAERTRG